MSKMTMRQFVKKTAKRNDIKLKHYTYHTPMGMRIAHEADDVRPLPDKRGFITPTTCLAAINKLSRLNTNQQ